MADNKEKEIGPGIYVRDTGPTEEVGVNQPDSRNRTWLMPDGSTQRVGGQFKDGEQVPMQETDLDRIRREQGY